MMLFILPLVTKTTTYICSDLISICIQCEVDLESETESENSEVTNIDDDFVFSASSFLLSLRKQAFAASYTIEFKSRITIDDLSQPPEILAI